MADAQPRATIVEQRKKRTARLKRKANPRTTSRPKPTALAAHDERLRELKDELEAIEGARGPGPDTAAVLDVLEATRTGEAMRKKFIRDRRESGETAAYASMRFPRDTSPEEAYAIIEELLGEPGTVAVARALWDVYHT